MSLSLPLPSLDRQESVEKVPVDGTPVVDDVDVDDGDDDDDVDNDDDVDDVDDVEKVPVVGTPVRL